MVSTVFSTKSSTKLSDLNPTRKVFDAVTIDQLNPESEYKSSDVLKFVAEREYQIECTAPRENMLRVLLSEY